VTLFAPFDRRRVELARRHRRKLLDDLSAEGGQIVGLAGGDERPVDDDLLVDDLGTGVAQVGADRGHEVILRPRTTSASTSDHGPWQITPTGLPLRTKSRTKPIASSSPRSLSGLIVPPGRINPS